jgi:hypothetical protein
MLFLSLNKLYVSSVSFELNRPVGKHEVPNLVESEILKTPSFFLMRHRILELKRAEILFVSR